MSQQQFQPGDQVRFTDTAIKLPRGAAIHASGTVLEVEPAVEMVTVDFDSGSPMIYPARFLEKVTGSQGDRR